MKNNVLGSVIIQTWAHAISFKLKLSIIQVSGKNLLILNSAGDKGDEGDCTIPTLLAWCLAIGLGDPGKPGEPEDGITGELLPGLVRISSTTLNIYHFHLWRSRLLCCQILKDLCNISFLLFTILIGYFMYFNNKIKSLSFFFSLSPFFSLKTSNLRLLYNVILGYFISQEFLEIPNVIKYS